MQLVFVEAVEGTDLMAENIPLAGNSIMLETIPMYLSLLGSLGLIRNSKSVERILTVFGLTESDISSTSFWSV